MLVAYSVFRSSRITCPDAIARIACPDGVKVNQNFIVCCNKGMFVPLEMARLCTQQAARHQGVYFIGFTLYETKCHAVRAAWIIDSSPAACRLCTVVMCSLDGFIAD